MTKHHLTSLVVSLPPHPWHLLCEYATRTGTAPANAASALLSTHLLRIARATNPKPRLPKDPRDV